MLDGLTRRARLHARALRDGTRPVPLGARAAGEDVQVRRGRSVLHAEIVDRFDAWALRDECRDLVVDVLAHACIPQRTLPSLDDQPHRVVVSSTDAERVRLALRALGADRRLHVARVTPSGRGAAVSMSSTPELRGGDVIRAFAAQVSVAGRLLPTRDLGVDVEVWEQITSARPSPDGPLLPTGTLVPPRTNPYARSLPPGALDEPAADPPSPSLEQVTFPVDVVYTWVDSDDPAWQDDLAAHRDGGGLPASHASALSPSRFTNREELRYSLRSIAAYASWVRTIYVVTNGQVPPWLDVDHPQIQVVRHDEIFPDPSDLPTFNSHAIEANLHRIPGLAQHYLYLNDDVFLARPLRPEHFFTGSGLLRHFPSMVPVDAGLADATDLPVVSAFKNGRALVEERFGRRPTARPRHTPHPQRKDVLEDIDRDCPEVVRRTSSARFRSPNDVSVAAQLQASWAAATGRGVAADTRYEFIDIGDPASEDRIERMLVRADLDCFCLNETSDTDPDLADARVRRILTTLLPFTSPYEI